MSDKENMIPNEPEVEIEAEAPKSKKVEYDESLFENSTIFGTAAHQKKKRKFTPMVRGFIISGISLVVAGVILATVLLIPKSTDKDNTSSMAPLPSYTVTAIDEGNIDSVQVFNATHPEGFRLIRGEAETSDDTSSESASTYNWLVEGYEKYNLSGAKYLVQSAVALKSSKKYEKSASSLTADDIDIGTLTFDEKAEKNDKDTYGFLNPFSLLVLKGESVDKNIIVGNMAPDKSGRYVTVTGDSNVYVVSESNMSYFDGSYHEMVGVLINDYIMHDEGTADYYDDGALARIDKLVLGGSCRKKTIRVETPPDDLSIIPFVVTEPVFRAGDEEAISEIMNVASAGLSNYGSYVIGYTKEDYTKYGLDKPLSTLEIVIGTYRVNLTFGPVQEDGCYPCVKEGSDIIYKVLKEGNEWVEYVDTDLYYDTLFLEYVSGVSTLEIKTDKKDVKFELVRENPEEKSKYTIKCEQAQKGATIEAKQFNFYYGRILNLATEEFTEEPAPTGDAYMTITVNYTDKSRSADVIRLYKHSARRYFYTLNGQGNSLISKSSVDDLYTTLDTLLKGKEIGRG